MDCQMAGRRHVGILKDITPLRGNQSQSKASNKVRFSPNPQLCTFDSPTSTPDAEIPLGQKLFSATTVGSCIMESTTISNDISPNSGSGDSPVSSLVPTSAYSTPKEQGIAVALKMGKAAPIVSTVANPQRDRRCVSVAQNGSPVQRKPIGRNSSPSLRTGIGPTLRTSRDAYKVIMGEQPSFPPRQSSILTSSPSDTIPPKLPEKGSVVSRLSRPTAASAARSSANTSTSAIRTASAKRTANDMAPTHPIPESGTMNSIKSVGKDFRSRLSAMITSRGRSFDIYQRAISNRQRTQLMGRESVAEIALEGPNESPIERLTIGVPESDSMGANVDSYLSMSRDQFDRLVQATRGIRSQEMRGEAIQAVTAYGEALVAVTVARKANEELSAAIVALSRRATELGSQALAVVQV